MFVRQEISPNNTHTVLNQNKAYFKKEKQGGNPRLGTYNWTKDRLLKLHYLHVHAWQERVPELMR